MPAPSIADVTSDGANGLAGASLRIARPARLRRSQTSPACFLAAVAEIDSVASSSTSRSTT
jgi:hypothetical protein